MKIVVAYDGSEDAKEGLKRATKFLEEEKGEIIVLTVVPIREDMTKEEVANAKNKAENLLKEAKALIPQVPLRSVLVEDYSVAEAILKFVEKEEADLLLMGARGSRPDILRFTLGSTTAKVVSFAPCSVFIIRKKFKEE
ncbi:MAG: universal stress protein [Caldimicrobium sp.]|nr:universal stress protein [Caldimicrobium sp.]MCX7874069.1 universal stress protein [Caldimicrobium sp.]MDW8093893.1 universal stress protein [Caldimicrobium sp.]